MPKHSASSHAWRRDVFAQRFTMTSAIIRRVASYCVIVRCTLHAAQQPSNFTIPFHDVSSLFPFPFFRFVARRPFNFAIRAILQHGERSFLPKFLFLLFLFSSLSRSLSIARRVQHRRSSCFQPTRGCIIGMDGGKGDAPVDYICRFSLWR